MLLPQLYSGDQSNNSLEGSPRFVEKHDCPQIKYPSSIGQTCVEGRSSFYYSVPSSYCVYESQCSPIDDNIIFEEQSGPSAYASPINAVSVLPNSCSTHHESGSGKSENNSPEINPEAYPRKQNDPSALTLDGGGNSFSDVQDFMDEESYNLTTVNKKGKRKPKIAKNGGHILAGRIEHIDFQVKRTTRDFKGSRISGPSGRIDRHSKVLTSKGPRDRRIRLSVGAAINLYGLQDRLGLDQPSKVVEWLIEKSQAAIRELPQVPSIFCSDISPYVDYNSAAVCVSCHQTEDLHTLSPDNACTTSGDCLEASTYPGQMCSLATTTESNSRGSIIREEKREQRPMAVSLISSRLLRAAANGVNRKEFRAKARERARQRTQQKEKLCNKNTAMYGLLQPSSLPTQSPAFSLLDNSTLTSSLNMIHETMNTNRNTEDFLQSLMFPKASILCSRSNLCISCPPPKVQSSLTSHVLYPSTQKEGIGIQSTQALCGLEPEVFRVTSDPFLPAAATSNKSSSHCKSCSYPSRVAHLDSSNLWESCIEDSIAMPGAYNCGLEISYEKRQPVWNNEIFEEPHVNEEIPSIKSSNECVPSTVRMSNPPAYIGIFDLLQ